MSAVTTTEPSAPSQETTKSFREKHCPICWEDWDGREELEARCHHVFHKACLRNLHNCPICRQSLYEERRVAQVPASSQNQMADFLTRLEAPFFERQSQEAVTPPRQEPPALVITFPL